MQAFMPVFVGSTRCDGRYQDLNQHGVSSQAAWLDNEIVSQCLVPSELVCTYHTEVERYTGKEGMYRVNKKKNTPRFKQVYVHD